MNIHEIVASIQALEKELNLKNPHSLSENAVKISLLLAELSEPLSDLELQYQLLRSKTYHDNLKEMRPTPAKDSLEFDPILVERKSQILKLQEFSRTREKLISRIENHLKNKTGLESRGI